MYIYKKTEQSTDNSAVLESILRADNFKILSTSEKDSADMPVRLLTLRSSPR